MSQPLRIDPARVDTLIPRLNALAQSAREQYRTLESGLAGHGRPWGNDEAGKTFAEGYEPRAEKSLEALQNLAGRLAEASRQIRDATNRLYDTDLSNALDIYRADPGYLDWSASPQGPAAGAPQTPVSGPNAAAPSDTPEDRPGDAADSWTGNGGTGANGPAHADAPTDVPVDLSVDTASDGADSAPPASNSAANPMEHPGSTGAPYPGRAGASGDMPGSAVRPEGTSGSPSTADRGAGQTGSAPGTPASTQSRDSTTAPGSASNGTAKTTDPGTRAPGGRASAETPWTRPQPGTPWGPGAARSARPPGIAPAPPGPAIPPRRAGREPLPTSPAQGKPDKKRSPKKRPAPLVSTPATNTDAAALAAAQALAGRHDLRLTGFTTSGIAGHTVIELAAALDDTLAKYPLLKLGGIAISVLAAGAIAEVHWHGAEDGPWISIDRKLAADPDKFDAAVEKALRAGRVPRGSEQRPIYATVVHALGRVLVAAAGPGAQQLAQRSLVTEYRRISGPWDGITLAGVVAGYRSWRDQLSPSSFQRGRFHPQTALENAFTEVELRGADASGPAKALHRLVVEMARGRPG